MAACARIQQLLHSSCDMWHITASVSRLMDNRITYQTQSTQVNIIVSCTHTGRVSQRCGSSQAGGTPPGGAQPPLQRKQRRCSSSRYPGSRSPCSRMLRRNGSSSSSRGRSWLKRRRRQAVQRSGVGAVKQHRVGTRRRLACGELTSWLSPQGRQVDSRLGLHTLFASKTRDTVIA
jgi:hypothetical protein